MQAAAGQPAQLGRHPEPVVVEAARVEADHEARRADAVGQRLDVGGQVGAAALLAGLDEHDAAGVGAAGGLHRLDGGEAGEGGVAVVGPAPAVEPVALEHRRPRAEALAPAGHLGLLVEVAVEQDGVVGVDRRRPAGTSITITGVRPGSSCTSTVRPAIGPGRAPRRGPARRPRPCGRARPSRRRRRARRWGCGCSRGASAGCRRPTCARRTRPRQQDREPRPDCRSVAVSAGRTAAQRGRWASRSSTASASATIWRDQLAGRHQLVDGADALAGGQELAADVDLGAVRARRGGWRRPWPRR